MREIIVVKRNGDEMPYNSKKIELAVNKAIQEVEGNLEKSYLAENVAKSVDSYMDNYNVEYITVEEIQDLVENALIYCGDYPEIARAYIRYRYKREVAREQKDTFFKAISDKLAGIGVENSNANMDENSFSGRIGTASSVMTKEHALKYQMSALARDRHLNNEIYTHDLDHLSVGDHNCLTAPLDRLLAEGFKVRQTDVRPAGSVNTAFQLTAVIFQLQSLQQFGGISAGHIDWTMVPYVRKSFYKHYIDGLCWGYNKELPENHWLEEFEKKCNNTMSIDDSYYKEVSIAYDYAMKMTEREVHQATEALYHNLK